MPNGNNNNAHQLIGDEALTQVLTLMKAEQDELAGKVEFAGTKNITVDFLTNADTVQFTNLYGAINIQRIVGINVATLKISYGNVLEQSVTLGNTDIDIADGLAVTLKITRTTSLQDAALTLKFGPAD